MVDLSYSSGNFKPLGHLHCPVPGNRFFRSAISSVSMVQSGSLEGSFSCSCCLCTVEFLLVLTTFLFLASWGGSPSEGGGLVIFFGLGVLQELDFQPGRPSFDHRVPCKFL